MCIDQPKGSVQDQSISCFSATLTSRRLAANHPWRCPRLHVIEESMARKAEVVLNLL